MPPPQALPPSGRVGVEDVPRVIPAAPSPSGEARAGGAGTRRVARTPAVLSGLAGMLPAHLASDPITASSEATEDETWARIEWWLDFWQGRGRAAFLRGLSRMGRYEEHIAGEIAARGLPASLLYLPLIEANYYPTAVSPVGAGGLWQLMPPTARWLGMRVDGLVDERFDPFAATPVALGYLIDLKEQFGSWFLALAAYNGGPGRLERIIARHGGAAPRDDAMFARIRHALPRETRDFIPKYLAAVLAASSPGRYGLGDFETQAARGSATTRVEGAASLDILAHLLEVETQELQDLNPHLRRSMTPPDDSTPLYLPRSAATEDFAQRLASIPPHRRVTTHVVAAGETLTRIARYYDVSVAELQQANPAVEPRRMQIGEVLSVPTGLAAAPARPEPEAAREPEAGGTPEAGGAAAAAAGARSGSGRGDGAEVVHVVQRGQNLWVISRMHGTSVARLRDYNGLDARALLHPGDTIRVPTSSPSARPPSLPVRSPPASWPGRRS